MLVGAGISVLLIAAALWQAFDARQFRDWRRFSLALAACVPLGALAGVFVWLGVTYPTVETRNNRGFPPDWSCLNLPKGAQVCGPDKAPAKP